MVAAPKMFCASCIRPGPGLRPRQLDEGGPIFLFCERCDSEVPGRSPGPSPEGTHWTGSRYQPIDEIERGMPIAILRTIRRFDWISSVDLSVVLEIPNATDDSRGRNAYSVALSRMCREGYIEVKMVRARPIRSQAKRPNGFHEWNEYRIAPLGIARLEWSFGATLASVWGSPRNA